jgi:doubled CXXCH motif protein
MWRPRRIRSDLPPKAERPGSRRDLLAVLLALVTVVCLGSGLFLSKGTQLLMPGPLASAHGAIENCSACHTKSGKGKLSWLHGLVASDPLADSKACLTCHKMPDTAFNAHSASAEALKQSTARLTKIAAETPQPQSARAQSTAFPTHDMVARGLYCATCHQEHQGVSFNLNKISNEQCRSCHAVKFDSFDGHHPKFENYPFKRRTRIVYDHAGHFGKHYPEVAKKNPAKRIPETCSSCHDSREDKRVMAVAPFEKTCTGCHLDQIVGKERASGPKGIAFLSLPGLDLQTLRKKNAPIGEWPDASDAALTPFMQVMIGRDERGRALIKTVDRLNLQDLTAASDDQIKAVTDLVWEIKGLFYALIKGKASDVLGNFNIGGGAKLSANLVADLTASIPRDVVMSAQQQWLPNLATEMANGREASEQKKGGWTATTTGSTPPASAPPEESSDQEARDETPAVGAQKSDSEAASVPKRDPPPCLVGILGQCLMFKGAEEASQSEEKSGTGNAKQDGRKETPSAADLPGAMRAGVKEAEPPEEPETVARKADTANAKPDAGKKEFAANDPPQANGADQKDDLLFPTEEELRGIKAHDKGAEKSAQPEGAGSNAGNTPADSPAASGTAAAGQTRAAPVISIASDVDPESWAEYGGWYRQDYAIFYRPTGHKDKLIYSWLFLTGPQAPKGGKSPAAAVFDFLTSKDAQGSCTKCHSVDDIQGRGRIVNFSPPSVESKRGRFTNFIHEPHFGVMENRTGVLENRGCLTCHSLEKGRPYLKSYEQGNPQSFVSNFGEVKKDLCQTCHTSGMARQDCLLCHKYHVNGAIAPIMNTRLPAQ